MAEADILAERLKKLQILKDAGMEPYPAHSARDTSITDFLKGFKEGNSATLAGRVMSVRGQGGIMFADIFDGSTSLTAGGTDRAQFVLQADAGADIALFEKVVDVGDFIEAEGKAYTTKRGQDAFEVAPADPGRVVRAQRRGEKTSRTRYRHALE